MPLAELILAASLIATGLPASLAHADTAATAATITGQEVGAPHAPGGAASPQGGPRPAVSPQPAPQRPARAVPTAPDPRPPVEIALENQFLSEEVKLAQQPRIYVVFDVPGRMVQVKARGAVFREWAISDVQSLGADLAPVPRTLSSRKASSVPKRFQVEPPPLAESSGAEAETGSAQAQTPGGMVLADEPEETAARSAADELSEKALEVTDMPSRYDLAFDGDLRVEIIPRTSGFGGGLSSALSALGYYIKLPYRFLAAKRGGRPLTVIRVHLEPADAQALYWAFPEGTKALFRLDPPRP